VVVAGWWALLVPALALLAVRRPGVLAPVAFVSLAAAGVVAATGAGEPVRAGEGAFGHLAQVLALIGLFAALVTVGAPRGRDGRTQADDGDPGATAVLPPVTPAPAPAAGPHPPGFPPAGAPPRTTPPHTSPPPHASPPAQPPGHGGPGQGGPGHGGPGKDAWGKDGSV